MDEKIYAVAYDHILNSCKSVLNGYFKEFETESQRAIFSSQDLLRLRELNAKTKVMRELICFM